MRWGKLLERSGLSVCEDAPSGCIESSGQVATGETATSYRSASYQDMLSRSSFLNGLNPLKATTEPTLILSPDAVLLDEDIYEVQIAALSQCQLDLLETREAASSWDWQDGVTEFRDRIGINALRYGACYTPHLQVPLQQNVSYRSLKGHVSALRLLAPDNVLQIITNLENAINHVDSKKADPSSTNAERQEAVELALALESDLKRHYPPYDHLVIKASHTLVTLPPSEAIAGVYATTDANRGVWKAPANISINLARNLTYAISHTEQEDLNVDPIAGKSINAIRQFTGNGILVWGSRMLAGNDNE